MRGEPLQNAVQNSPRLARLHHVGVKIVKHLGIFAQRIGESRATLNRPAHPAERFGKTFIFLLTGEDFHFHCHSNLVRAVAPFGLTEFDVHDVLNVFQVTGLNDSDRYFMKACPAKPGDFLEFFAEIDLLCALSTCPGGDLSVPLWGPEAKDPLEVCRPLGIEIHRLDAALLAGWRSPEPAAYRGRHGMVLDQPDWKKRP